MSKPVNRLLTQSVTRKQFLQHLLVGIITVLGITNFIHYLKSETPVSSPHDLDPNNPSRRGFGSSKFGA
ncbi:hypothetical protein EPO04_01160 [Patescibacteria group bacterium]|nr:MAG: hypothetical protein EPO04_01160 [Patescibacteria group bacterium]